MEVLRVILTATSSFLALFIIAKIMGKKQIAQLEFVDYVVGISIGSIAAQMAVDSQIPQYHFLIAMALYAALDFIINLLSRKSIKIRKLLQGTPLILVYNGKLNYENLVKSKLDLNQFLSMCREKNFFDVNDIAYCIFETDGQLSILPKENASPTTCGDMNLDKEKSSLSIDFIMDGRIIENALKEAGKDKKWLLSKLGMSEEEVKSVALASYDKKNDDVIAHYK
ncbi:MAG: DUF421 domain-containing protein [Clostridiales bacterium]|jgi:uncharacterized membrane protein YcaP (DUF421 family)|nr:DUF421 domain-containing protein [Clostridiales bacterium]